MDAIVAAQRALGRDPSNASGHYALVTVLLEEERAAEALEAIDRAIQIQNDVPAFLRFRILVLMHLDQSWAEEAVRELEKCEPLTADLINPLGCLAEERSYSEARALYGRALDVDPKCQEAAFNYSRIFWIALPRAATIALLGLGFPLTMFAAGLVGALGAEPGSLWPLLCAPFVFFAGTAMWLRFVARARRLAATAPVWRFNGHG